MTHEVGFASLSLDPEADLLADALLAAELAYALREIDEDLALERALDRLEADLVVEAELSDALLAVELRAALLELDRPASSTRRARASSSARPPHRATSRIASRLGVG